MSNAIVTGILSFLVLALFISTYYLWVVKKTQSEEITYQKGEVKRIQTLANARAQVIDDTEKNLKEGLTTLVYRAMEHALANLQEGVRVRLTNTGDGNLKHLCWEYLILFSPLIGPTEAQKSMLDRAITLFNERLGRIGLTLEISQNEGHHSISGKLNGDPVRFEC